MTNIKREEDVPHSDLVKGAKKDIPNVCPACIKEEDGEVSAVIMEEKNNDVDARAYCPKCGYSESLDREYDATIVMFYVLMRDYLHTGALASIVQDLEAHESMGMGFGYTFSNVHLAAYARDLKKRLDKLLPLDLGTGKTPNGILEKEAKLLGIDIIDRMDRVEAACREQCVMYQGSPPPQRDLDPCSEFNDVFDDSAVADEMYRVGKEVGVPREEEDPDASPVSRNEASEEDPTETNG